MKGRTKKDQFGNPIPTSSKMLLFPEAYVIDRNACAACRRVGYKEGAVVKASARLMKDPWILARIAELDADARQRFDASRENVLLEFARIGFSDIRRIFRAKDDGNGFELVPVPELDDDTAAAISQVKFLADGSLEYKLWPKDAALTSLARNLGLFKLDNEQTGTQRELIDQIIKWAMGGSVGPIDPRDQGVPGEADPDDGGELSPALHGGDPDI